MLADAAGPAVGVAVLVLVGVVALAATFGLVVATTHQADQARVDVGDGELVVRARRAMALWAIRREVRVPIGGITEVVVADRDECPSGLRMPGTYLKGQIQAGTYRKDGERTVWFVGRAHDVVLVRAPGCTPSAVVAQVADPVATVAAVRQALARGPGAGGGNG